MHTVTDADRRAYLAWSRLPSEDQAAVLAGKWDETTGMQILVDHRIEAREQALEEAAAYLDDYAGGHHMAKSCATAIRALKEGRNHG